MKRILLSGWNACLSKNYPALSARIPIHTARRREVHASTMFLTPGLEPDCSIRNQPLHKPWPPCLSQYFLKAPVISILLCNINTGRLGCDTAICQHYRVSEINYRVFSLNSKTRFLLTKNPFFITITVHLHFSVHRNYLRGSPDWRQGLL